MMLRNKDNERLIEIFESAKIEIEVLEFGRRVNGENHKGSELNLVIRTPNLQKLTIEIYANLNEKIKESNIPILVESFDWVRLPESFHQKILLQHEVLFSNIPLAGNEPKTGYKKTNNL